MSPESSDQTGRIPAIWPESSQNSWMDLARKSQSEQPDPYQLARIWLERPDSGHSVPNSCSFGRNPVTFVGIQPLLPESGQPKF
jgi:hypothetical protein